MNENREIIEAMLSENEALQGEVWEDKPDRELPMRWHKFLIYFALWFGALQTLLNLCTHVYAMLKSGSAYWNAVSTAYLWTSILESILISASICLGVCVRFRLAQRKRNGPRLLLILYGLKIAHYVIFTLAFNLSTGWAPFTNIDPISIIGYVLMILANNKYYYRRRHLFVN